MLGACAAAVWLSVGTFPLNRSYEVVAINGRPLPQFITANRRLVTKYRPNLRVIWSLVGETRVVGWSGCNSWDSRVRSLWWGRFALKGGYRTALACSPAAMENEHAFHMALRMVTRWRHERGELVLEGDGIEIRLRRAMAPPF